MISREELKLRVRGVQRGAVVLHDRHLTVLASSPAAEELSPAFTEGVNLVRFTFIDAADSAGELGWPEASDQIVAMFRESFERSIEDDVFRGIVGELSTRSRRFAQVWARDVAAAAVGTTALRVSSEGNHLCFESISNADVEADGLLVFGVPAEVVLG